MIVLYIFRVFEKSTALQFFSIISSFQHNSCLPMEENWIWYLFYELDGRTTSLVCDRLLTYQGIHLFHAQKWIVSDLWPKFVIWVWRGMKKNQEKLKKVELFWILNRNPVFDRDFTFFYFDFYFSFFIWTFIFPCLFGFLFLFRTFISFLDFYFHFCTNHDLILDFFQVLFIAYEYFTNFA